MGDFLSVVYGHKVGNEGSHEWVGECFLVVRFPKNLLGNVIPVDQKRIEVIFWQQCTGIGR
jgi:hypothetical protein